MPQPSETQSTLENRVFGAYPTLSRGERRIADVLIETGFNLASFSAGELADRAEVSNATAARFFKRLGYDNFRAARAQVRQAGTGVGRETPASLIRSRSQPDTDLNLHLANDIQNLKQTVDSLRRKELDTAIEALSAAQRIWVVGYGDNYPLAHFARAILIRIKPDIRIIPIGGFSVPEEFASLTPHDTMLALGLRRRTRTLVQNMRTAREAGSKIVLFTDMTSSRVERHATVTLRCSDRGAAIFDSFAAPVSLLTYLCSEVAIAIGEQAVERLHRIDSIHQSWQDLDHTSA